MVHRYQRNGRWDEEDIWIKLGKKGDQPSSVTGMETARTILAYSVVVARRDRALATEPGLLTPELRSNQASQRTPRKKMKLGTTKNHAANRDGRPRADD